MNRSFIFIALSVCLISVSSCSNTAGTTATLNGYVRSGNQAIGSALVTLLATEPGHPPQVLNSAYSDSDGFFFLSYNVPSNPKSVLYVIAESQAGLQALALRSQRSQPLVFASVLGTSLPDQTEIVINERSTIATAYAMAQFFEGKNITGPSPGLQNAAATAANLVDIHTGEVASVLNTFPNGSSTSARPTFNSLANMLAACVQSVSNCNELFALATTPAGLTPSDTLQAALNIAHFPWQNVAEILDFSLRSSVYTPALAADAKMTAWILALRYDGNGMEFDGPGNVAFDKDGNAWIVNNYIFQLDPLDPGGNVCGGTQLLALTPTGDDLPGAPFDGGGVYGAGYGVGIDPDGHIWVGNFGFQGTNCPLDFNELSRTVSEFAADGTAISPDSQGNGMGEDHGGYPGAGNTIRQPQGTVSDRDGNIWIANCSGDNVTQFPGGDPDAAFEIKPLDDSDNPLVVKPFGIAFDRDGNGWVTSNGNHSVFAFDSDGTLLHSLTGSAASDAGINHPMGIASDSQGNLWVSNSGLIRAPCDGDPVPDLLEVVLLTLGADFANPNASIALIYADGTPAADGPFKGGGVELPWGIAVDGNDNVWVANFNGRRISEFCGVNTQHCPPGFETGDPISPDEGYFFDGLRRITGIQIDPSGNVWMANNWLVAAFPENPGGHEMVVFVGLAKPIKAPLTGPPQAVN